MSIYGEGLYRCPIDGVEVAPAPRPEEQLARREWEPACPACGAALEPLPTPESKPLQPTSIYAIGKRDHEEMFLTWGRAYGVPTTALRFFNVYGPRQALSNPYTGVGAIFASRLLNGRPPVIFEDGGQSRDFIHVSDIAAGIEAALDPVRADGPALNLGTGRGVSRARGRGRPLARASASRSSRRSSVTTAPATSATASPRSTSPASCSASSRRCAFEEGMGELTGWLAGQSAVDRVDEATAALRARGLAR